MYDTKHRSIAQRYDVITPQQLLLLKEEKVGTDKCKQIQLSGKKSCISMKLKNFTSVQW